MNDVKRKLKLLRSCKPTIREKDGFRSILRAHIEYDLRNRAHQQDAASAWVFFTPLRITSATLSITLLTGGTGAAFASQNAVPGDILYPVKITTEQLRVAINADEAKKAALHLEFAAKRLREMAQLAQQNKLEAASSEIIFASYQAELQKSRELLSGNQGKTTQIASLIEQATQTQQTTLTELSLITREENNTKLKDQFEELKDRVEEHNDEASFVLIQEPSMIKAVATTTTGATPENKKQAFKKSNEKIKKAQERMREVSKKLREANVDQTVITEITARLSEATSALERAEQTRNNGFYRDSLTESVRARVIANEAERAIKERKKKDKKSESEVEKDAERDRDRNEEERDNNDRKNEERE